MQQKSRLYPTFHGGRSSSFADNRCPASPLHKLEKRRRRPGGAKRPAVPRKEGYFPQRSRVVSEHTSWEGGLGKEAERELGEVEISGTPRPGAEEGPREPEEHE